MDNR
jgi:hypothetical protein